MIQNILTFCVKNDLTYVEGSLPSGKLVANDVNRNSIYLITPYSEAIVKANFQTNLQSDTPTSVLGILVDGKISVDELVDKDKSYYNLVKDWHIYEFKVPSTTLSFISRNRTGQIGINFSIEQRLVPAIKPSYGEFLGEIIDGNVDMLVKDGYAINKTVGFVYDQNIEFGLNDLLLYNYTDDLATKVSAYSNRGSTPTAMYSVDPSVLNDNFETIEPSLTEQIIEQVNDNTSNIVAINLTLNGVLDDIVDLENRISQTEQDIDDLEANSVRVVGGFSSPTILVEAVKHTSPFLMYNVKANINFASKNDLIKVYDVGLDRGIYVSNEDVQDTIKNGIIANQRSLRDTVKNVVDEVAINNEWQSKDYIDNGLALKENKSEKGVANGYASLDSSAKIPSSQLPDSILGQLEYKGTFDPNDGYPVSPEKGWFYISIANALISGVDYKVGDWAVYNGSSWDKVDNTDAVASVNGKLGAVILYGNEIQVGNGDTWTIEQRIVDIYAQLNDRYTKAQTYSAFEIEQKFAELMATSTLKDSAIPNPNGGFVFENYDNLLLSDISQYAVVMFKKTSTTSPNNVEWGTFKPLEMQVGNNIIFDDGLLAFDGTQFYIDSQEETQIKFWGFKLDGINATEVEYSSGVSVKQKLDLVDTNIDTIKIKDTEQDKKLNEIQENLRKVASGEVSAVVSGADIINLPKNTANAPMSVQVDGGVLEAPNLVVNGDFSDGIGTWSNYSGTILSTISNKLNVSIATANGTFRQENSQQAGDYYAYLEYDTGVHSIYSISIRTFIDNTQTNIYTMGISLGISKGSLSILNNFSSFDQLGFIITIGSSTDVNILIDNIKLYNVSQMKLKGIKNDDGVLFSDLSNEQIKTQLDLWVSKGIIPNDNLLSVNMNKRVRSEVGGNTINKMYQLVSNYDLTLDSNSDGIPDGFSLINATDISLTNGVAKFTATANLGRMFRNDVNIEIGETVYYFARVKTSNDNTQFYGGNSYTSVPNTNSFEFISAVKTPSTSTNIQLIGVYDNSSSDWTPIEVDYMGVFNVSQMKKDGWFVGMDNTQIKAFLDKVLQQGKATSDLYLQANTKGYSLPNGVKDTIEYRNGKYYFVKRVDDTDLNNLVELSPYVETEIEAFGVLNGCENGVVYVDDIKFDADIYDNGITTTSPIKALESITKLVDGVETQLDINNATIALDKLSFTHTELNDGDIVWFTYEEDGDFYKGRTHITYYLDNMVRTSPDGSVWKLDWSVDNSGVVTWTPTKI